MYDGSEQIFMWALAIAEAGSGEEAHVASSVPQHIRPPASHHTDSATAIGDGRRDQAEAMLVAKILEMVSKLYTHRSMSDLVRGAALGVASLHAAGVGAHAFLAGGGAMRMVRSRTSLPPTLAAGPARAYRLHTNPGPRQTLATLLRAQAIVVQWCGADSIEASALLDEMGWYYITQRWVGSASIASATLAKPPSHRI